MRNMKRWAVAGATFAGAASISLLSAPGAWADSSASVPGAKATFESTGEIFTLEDTKCDDDPVYLLYKIDGEDQERVDFSEGCDNSSEINLEIAEGESIKYRACVNSQLSPDKCSGWTSDRA